MKKPFSSNLKILFLSLLLISSTSGFSATIKGHVKDMKNGEGLIGATVYLKENNQVNDVAGLDGTYILKNVKPGTYTVVVQYFSYITQEKSVIVGGDADAIVQDFSLQPDSTMLKQVEVVGGYDRESDNYARDLEKNSNYEVNILSGKTMLLMPDITVGSVLQRVSGVVMEKSTTGGGKYATIRGMDKRYNYTTINGVKVPSPDYSNNYVPLDLFPSDILERLEVIKTLRPDMYGDAIGGAMNLVLKSPPDYLTISAHVATGYSQTLLNTDFTGINSNAINLNSPEKINGPTYAATASDFPVQPYIYNTAKASPDIIGGFTIGDRFLNNKLGVLFSGSYQNTNSSTTAFFLTPSSQPVAANTGVYSTLFTDADTRTYSTREQRYAGNLKLDYEFSPKHKISFYTVYVGLNQFRADVKVDTTFQTLKVKKSYETKVTYENIFNASLQGKDSIVHNLLLDWTGSYARGFSNTPEWGTLSFQNGGTAQTAANFYYSSWGAKWWQNTDQTYTGLINLTYNFSVAGENVMLKIGAMNEDKNRVDFYEDYSLSTRSSSYLSTVPMSDTLWSVDDPTGTPTNGNNYSVQQDITAVYGMTEFKIGQHVSLMGGLRGENTLLAYGTPISISVGEESGTIHYIDYLPSAQISYSITDKQAIRGSYFSSISRPNFNDLMPYKIATDFWTAIGNPYLLHTQAQNYDLRYEFFPTPTSQILAGVFYKNLIDPIEYTLVREKASSEFLQPVNDTNKAYCYGFEFVVTHYIKNFGISANYTYNKSQTTVSEQYYYNASGVPITINETRPLQGQATNIANVSLLYKNSKIGLDMNLSGVYTGKLISFTSPLYELDYWQLPQFRIDFSFEKRLSKKYKISVYGKVNNILNTALTIVQYPPGGYANTANTANFLPAQSGSGTIGTILAEQETFGQFYILGVRYKL